MPLWWKELKEGKREGIFSGRPSSSCFTADRGVFDAVMRSDGCNAQGVSCLRNYMKWNGWFRGAELHGNILTREGFCPAETSPSWSRASFKRENNALWRLLISWLWDFGENSPSLDEQTVIVPMSKAQSTAGVFFIALLLWKWAWWRREKFNFPSLGPRAY